MDKKLFFVIGSIVVVLILAAVWGYLLFFGPPSVSPIRFSDLELGDTTDSSIAEEPVTEPQIEPVVDVTSAEKLRQLTTRPVIGFRSVQQSTSSPHLMYFVEAGTGHVYSIDLQTGEEVRRSGTTVAMASEAAISPDGSVVVVRGGQGTRAPVQVGQYSSTTNSYEFTNLPGNWLGFAFAESGELLLAEQTNISVVATARDIDNEQINVLFTVPFREATISWGKAVSDTHYVYPKPTRHLEGYAYSVRGNTLQRLPILGNGLTVFGNDTGYIISTNQSTNRSEEQHYSSQYLANAQARPIRLPIPLLPQKCVFSTMDEGVAYCASGVAPVSESFPDSWYQGLETFSDNLFRVEVGRGVTELLAVPEATVGRPLDIQRLAHDEINQMLYFTHTHDKTLWLYEI
jgi:hypothetical protein